MSKAGTIGGGPAKTVLQLHSARADSFLVFR